MDRDLLTSYKMLLSACEALAQAMGNVVDSLPAAGSARHAVERAQRNLGQARALTPDAEPTNAPQQDHEFVACLGDALTGLGLQFTPAAVRS